jgi:D-amino-acid dehydrogenase
MKLPKIRLHDEVGNCVLFVKQLKTITQALGVKFLFNSPVQSIERQDNNSIHIHCRDLTLRAEAVVVCAGVQSASLVKPLGITLPLYPAESYSSVFNLKTTEYAPSLTLIDETNRVSIARLGNRLRLTGLIGFVPHTLTPHKKAVHALHKIGYELFPNAVNYSSATSWSRTIALTPNGLPLLGATSHGNIFINTGHGINGWAAAVASAKILSDHLLERPTEIDVTGLFNHI